jgi:uncharacterized repeat protein (TIGR01451 family)
MPLMSWRRVCRFSIRLLACGFFIGFAGWVAELQAFSQGEAPYTISGIGGNAIACRGTTAPRVAHYELELKNNSEDTLRDAYVKITLPAGFSYIANSTTVLSDGTPSQIDEPKIDEQNVKWDGINLPGAGTTANNPYGIHTYLSSCDPPPARPLDRAKDLIGSGGYVTQLFYPIQTDTAGANPCVSSYILEAYGRNLKPIVRLEGNYGDFWQAPPPGANGDYAEIAAAYARYVADLPRRDAYPLTIAIWNEPNLNIEWSNKPNARAYARFFVAVAKAIHNLHDPRIKVINGALSPNGSHISFLDTMLHEPGFRDSFDLWASHCYPYNHPDTYNIHSGTARYGEYAIDCYKQELDKIAQYGRSNVKVMITETGYELGKDTFGFEGFPAIDENNRAGYITGAFRKYWSAWPEVQAVTPFELFDPSGGWDKMDWVYPTLPYPPHPQFDSVAVLEKPRGALRPYGFKIRFQVLVDNGVPSGVYTSLLSAWKKDGVVVTVENAAPVNVSDEGECIYMPLVGH